jgi:4-methylaminobutanoate oxidase (formaldehyde-forming)
VNNPIPTSARVVIIGGGIIGCSVAYHLTKLGWRDVVVLEQNPRRRHHLARRRSGRLPRTSTSLTAINKYSVELYQNLDVQPATASAGGSRQPHSVGRSEAR